MKNIFQTYETKSFAVQKALMFGKYSTLSFEAKLSWSMYQELSEFDHSGLLSLNINDNRQIVKEEILTELLQYNLIYMKNDFMYFNSLEIDTHIINAINDFENKNIGAVSLPNLTNVKQLKQNEMTEKAYFESGNVPRELADTLRTFSNSIDEANEYFSIIMKAKKKVENEVGMVLWIEHDEGLNVCIVNSFVRSVRKVNKIKVNNPSGYIYKAIYRSITELAIERQHTQNKPTVLYNWLDE